MKLKKKKTIGLDGIPTKLWRNLGTMGGDDCQTSLTS